MTDQKITIYATVNQDRLTALGVPAEPSAVATFVKEFLLTTLPYGAVDRDNLTVQVEAVTRDQVDAAATMTEENAAELGRHQSAPVSATDATPRATAADLEEAHRLNDRRDARSAFKGRIV